jgi:hypothetical protein
MRRFLAILAPLLTSACIYSATTPARAETVHHSNLRHVVHLNRGLTLALQLPFLKISESMGNHDSKIVDADSVD